MLNGLLPHQLSKRHARVVDPGENLPKFIPGVFEDRACADDVVAGLKGGGVVVGGTNGTWNRFRANWDGLIKQIGPSTRWDRNGPALTSPNVYRPHHLKRLYCTDERAARVGTFYSSGAQFLSLFRDFWYGWVSQASAGIRDIPGTSGLLRIT